VGDSRCNAWGIRTYRPGLTPMRATALLRGLDVFLAQRDVQDAFEQVKALFLALVNVQGRPASWRYDRFHDEVAAVVLGAFARKVYPSPGPQ
jgi:hypothetical protein